MPQIGQIFRLRRAFPPYKFPNKFPNTSNFFRLRRAFPLPNLSSESRALFCDSKGCPQMRFAAPDFRFFFRLQRAGSPWPTELIYPMYTGLYNTIRTTFCGAFGTGKPYVWIFQSIWGPHFFPASGRNSLTKKILMVTRGNSR